MPERAAFFSEQDAERILISGGGNPEHAPALTGRLDEIFRVFFSALYREREGPPPRRSVAKGRGRPRDEALARLVGDLLGCVLDFLERGFGTSVGGQGKNDAGRAGGPVLRFMTAACDTMRAKLESGDVVVHSPELSAEAARRLARLTPEALRKRIRPQWTRWLAVARR